MLKRVIARVVLVTLLFNVIISVTPSEVGATVIPDWYQERLGLTTVTIPEDVTVIGVGAYANNQIQVVTIPESVTEIRAWAFERNPLNVVVILNPSTTIDGNAFAHSSGNLTIIGHLGSTAETFANAKGYNFSVGGIDGDYIYIDHMDTTATIYKYVGSDMDVVIPEMINGLTVTTIYKGVFNGKGLSSVSLPNSLIMIGDQAFVNNNLIEVIIPDNVITIGAWAFERNQIANLILGNQVTTIGTGAFSRNHLKSVIIPENVKVIEEWTFERNRINDVYIPFGIETIEKGAFLSNLITNVRIPASVTGIGQWAFLYNPFSHVVIEGETTTIGHDAFAEGLGNPADLMIIGQDPSLAKTHASDKGYTFHELRVSDDYEYIEHNPGVATILNYIGNSVSLEIPEMLEGLEVERIGARAFAKKSLTEVKIPLAVNEIGKEAFASNSLRTVVIPESVEIIGEGAFQYNHLFEFTLGENVKELGKSAFLSNPLTNVRIPASVTGIGQWAFLYNPLSQVVIEGETTTIGHDAFAEGLGNSADLMIIGQDPSLAKTHASDKGYTFHELRVSDDYEYIEHSPGVATILHYLGNSVSIEIPEMLEGLEVERIGSSAFAKRSLTDVNIPSSVKSIGKEAFSRNPIRNLVIRESVEIIGEGAFQYNHLFELTLGENVKEIGKSAFLNNPLTNVRIPASVTGIGQWAFLYNPLSQVVIEGETTTIGHDAFVGVHDNPNLRIISHESSLAKAHALEKGYSFFDINALPTVNFSPNGGTVNLTKIIVPTIQGGIISHYQWTNSEETPLWEDGEKWMEFTSEEDVTVPEKSGDWYLHVRVETVIGNEYYMYSKAFHISKSGSSNAGGSYDPSTPTNVILPQGNTININGVTINIPENAVKESTRINIRVLPNNDSYPLNENILSDIFEITKTAQGKFDKPITIILPFSSDLNPDHYDIGIYWLDESINEWIPLDNIQINWGESTVTGEVDHFTKFAVLAKEKEKLSDIQVHWAKESIVSLINRGAITGYPDGTFKPNNQITRAEFTTILVRALELETELGHTFDDTGNHWAKDIISTAYQNGIVQGFENSRFKPDEPITREQIASMIVNAFLLEEKTSSGSFGDQEDVSKWATKVIETVVEHGIIDGYEDGTIRPQNNATRAEAVVMIVRALEKE